MATGRQSTEVRREQIVRAALEIVGKSGVAGLSVGAVARRCGLVPSALYRHFRGKDAVLTALLEALRTHLREAVRVAREASPRALARLRRLQELHLEMAEQGAALPRVVFSEEVSAPGPEGAARRVLLDSALHEYLDAIAEIVEEGRRGCEVRADADPAAAAGLFLGAVQHAAVLAPLGGRTVDRRSHADRVWRAYAGALAVRSRS